MGPYMLLGISISQLFIALIILLYIVQRLCRRCVHLPPGPSGYPIIGCIPLMRNVIPSRLYNRLYRQHGNIYSMMMGMKLFVVVNGFKALRDVFVKHADHFSDRPDMYMFSDVFKSKGIISSSGEFWRQTRTHALKTLKKSGLNKRSFEEQLKEEVNAFLDSVGDQNGCPFDMKPVALLSSANVICNIMFGKRFDHADARLINLVRRIRQNGEQSLTVGLIGIFPFLKYVPGDILGMKTFEENMRTIWNFLQEQIDEHIHTLDDGCGIQDFVGDFLKQQNTAGIQNSVFADDNLLLCISDMFVAGTETSSTAINWATLYLVCHPDVQDKMRSEIEREVGMDRLPCFDDKPNLPYSEAVLNEVLRCGNILPLSLPHTATKQIDIEGFTIPKGACVVPNTGSVLNDPDEFENPERFCPERFINSDGRLFGNEKVALAFSLGRRVCIGESVARMELFCFLTSLIQRFRLLPETDGCFPSLDRIEGTVGSPKYFNVRAVKVLEE